MKKSFNSSITIETELSRDMGLTTALSIGVGTMIAAGIFTLSGLAVRNVGSAAIVAFLLASVVATFTALTYCEFVSIYPKSGEGYLYTRKTFPAPLAYFVGLALILGYSSSCAFYISSFSSYFYEFIWETPFEKLAGTIALSGLIILNIKGTKESGSFQVVVTVIKVILLIWFVSGGLSSVDPVEMKEKFSTDFKNIGATAAMVFITFFGFSAVAATAGEVKNPVKTIPRAIFLSMGIVTVLYTFVVLVIASGGLTEYTEAAMGTVAVHFLGPVGGIVIIGGALFSMISASNASIMAGSRIIMSMSRLGHFPHRFGIINPRTKTPILSTLIVGGTILVFITGFGLEDLAHFADTVLILALIMVNAALIIHRRKFPKLERPFRVPLVPLLPALGVLANMYLLIQISLNHQLPVILAVICLVIGIIVFLAWKSIQSGEVAIPGRSSRIALERSAKSGSRYKVLVPIANPANVKQLIDLAGAVASEHNGEIIALRVVTVPDQVSPTREDTYVERERQILELANSCAQSYKIPVTSLVRVGHDSARAILETARERQCDLIVLGWKGYTSTSRKILGNVVDDVVNHARCDIMLLKQVENRPLKKILLPTAGGEHARCAEKYAASIIHSHNGLVTVCGVISPDADDEKVTFGTEILNRAVKRVSEFNGLKVNSKIIRNKSVIVGIINESKDYDAIMVGASGRSIYPQILFGNIPEMIAKHSNCPVILVKHYHPVKELIGRVMEE